jgi:hypothetical protein
VLLGCAQESRRPLVFHAHVDRRAHIQSHLASNLVRRKNRELKNSKNRI